MAPEEEQYLEGIALYHAFLFDALSRRERYPAQRLYRGASALLNHRVRPSIRALARACGTSQKFTEGFVDAIDEPALR
jgi:hypothetical protein